MIVGSGSGCVLSAMPAARLYRATILRLLHRCCSMRPRLPPRDLHASFALCTAGRPSRLILSRITVAVEERIEGSHRATPPAPGTRLSSTLTSLFSAGTSKAVIVTTQPEPEDATSDSVFPSPSALRITVRISETPCRELCVSNASTSKCQRPERRIVSLPAGAGDSTNEGFVQVS